MMALNSDENLDVILGAASVALEMREEIPDLDAIVVSICGGSLAASTIMATANCKVIVVEPEGKDLEPSLKAGKRLWRDDGAFLETVADSLRLRQVGEIPFNLLLSSRDRVEVIGVTDDEMEMGAKLAEERMKIVVEAAAGAAIYAPLKPEFRRRFPGIKKIGIVVCGGNK